MKILENNEKYLLINIKNNNEIWIHNLKLVENNKNKIIKQLGM